MPDSRLPDRWLHDVDLMTLSPAAWQFFTVALMFCNARESDGSLRDAELRMLPIDPRPEAIAEVVATGRIQRTEGGYQFVGWDKSLGQTAAAALEARRDANRARQAAKRARDARAAESAPVTRESRAPSRRDSRMTPKERTRQGQDEEATATTGWPTATPGSGSTFPLPPYDGTDPRKDAA
ncbi:hypothetical protein OVA14_10550 [Agrococcus sp. SL85]|uniref:hypothetical protein n=1 Tax=Agrococcus sp. SL85 TaxID=2995141 RepID=UPI00226CE178|nr:hypothetical protein [Agrococcus sp. SL85]WAC65757.1 hypothetical protein OVA14_10550 [Agrococcus sp. SL85]